MVAALAAVGCSPQVHRIAGADSSKDAHRILFVSAGFNDAEMQTYRLVAKELANKVLTDGSLPYKTFADHLSFWRVDVRTPPLDTTKCPALTCSHSPLAPRTGDATPIETLNSWGPKTVDETLNVSLCYTETAPPGSCRLLWTDNTGQAIAARLATLPPNIDAVIILVNTTVPAGATQQRALAGSLPLVVVGVPGSQSLDILAHELGHVLGLADEYSEGVGLSASAADYPNVWQPTDPCYAPDTVQPANPTGQALHIPEVWQRLLECGADIDKSLDCDSNGDTTDAACPRVWDPTHHILSCPLPTVGIDSKCLEFVGLFEGAHYAPTGIYRPAYQCKMGGSNYRYCPVCDAHIQHFLDCRYVHPGPC
jgi:hypothetical protein